MNNKEYSWKEMGLTDFEYEKIKELLGREPNYVELGMYGVMWSEHCSYKQSRPLLKLFPTEGPQVLQGPGENAGVVDIGEGLGIAFKVESHNHPSAIEPYEGAATGVGGIIRDVFTMGARPIALLDALRFGSLDSEKSRYLFDGVVEGIAGYGNCIGIPTVAGETFFHESYEDNPLVNAMCVGVLKHEELAKGVASGSGNPVMVVGAKTGRDGIHGASFASEELSEASEEKRPAVQVGDPFMEKLLLEACLELIKSGAVVGMQDMGAAGLTSSSCEMATRGGAGIEMDLSMVPLREEGMTPYEIMMSESQERMLVVPQKGREGDVKAIFDKWGLDAVVVGKVTDDGIMRLFWEGEIVAEIPARTLTEECPVYYRESAEPAYYREKKDFDLASLPEPSGYTAVFLDMLKTPNLADKSWIYSQYDHMVGANTVVRPGGDAAVMRIKGTGKGIGLTIDCNSRYAYLDPYAGGAAAVAEAVRNLACTGAKALGATNCLNFGNPEKPEIFWQMENSVKGMAEACRVLDTPITGGNVSLYNETKGEAVYPTPVVGMVGVLDDVAAHCTIDFKDEGDEIILLGETFDELGGSEFLAFYHGLEAGAVPALDLEKEKRLQSFLLETVGDGLLKSAHDISSGGLAFALADSAAAGGMGIRATVESGLRASAVFFGESSSRAVVSISPEYRSEVLQRAEKHGIPAAVIGKTGGDKFYICAGDSFIDADLVSVISDFEEAVPCLMKD